MKKPHVLNRSMFNTGGTSAYGKGITSNLVSDEQRQRFNYGGRVRLAHGNIYTQQMGTQPTRERDFNQWYGHFQKPYEPIKSFFEHPAIGVGPAGQGGTFRDPSRFYYLPPGAEESVEKFGGTKKDIPSSAYTKIYGPESIHGESPSNKDLQREDFLYSSGEGDKFGEDLTWKKFEEEVEPTKKEKEEIAIAKENIRSGADDLGLYTDRVKPSRVEVKEDITERPGPTPTDTTQLDIEGLIDKYYDKKAVVGESLMGLAGTVLTASQQSKKEAAKTLGTGLGQFGKTLAADKKALKKIGMSGEITRDVYKTSQETKGIEQRKTDEAKYILQDETREPWNKFLALEKIFSGDTRRAIARSTGEDLPALLTKDDDGNIMWPTDATPGSTYYDKDNDALYVADAQGQAKRVNIKKFIEINWAGKKVKDSLEEQRRDIDALIT